MAKCRKYEELFIKENETELLEHIKICPDCALEHQKMAKVSSLLKEVSFTLRRQRAMKKRALSIAASFMLMLTAFFAIQYINPVANDMIASIQGDYTYEQMGLPVDDYGLIMVDFEE